MNEPVTGYRTGGSAFSSREAFVVAMAQGVFSERIANNAPITFEEAFAQGAAWAERSAAIIIDNAETPEELKAAIHMLKHREMIDRLSEEYRARIADEESP